MHRGQVQMGNKYIVRKRMESLHRDDHGFTIAEVASPVIYHRIQRKGKYLPKGPAC